jgi:gamma-F420-2:alpha-L-glutamate ligase
MKIWILAREGNFNSYENMRFKEVAEKSGIDLSFVAPTNFDLIVTKGGSKSILYQGNTMDLPDCLIPRRGSSSTYFTLAVIRHMERLGIPVVNSGQSIEAAKDKLATMQILAAHNIPIPKTMLAKFPLDLANVEREFSLPIILKTVSGSKGKGVFLCENRTQLEDLSDLMEISKDSKVNVILQEFISSSRGRDIRVIVIGGRPIGAMLRTASEGRVKANVHAGGSVSMFPMNREIEKLSVECADLLGLEIAGVDILFDGDSYMVAEVNSSPGFEGFEKATGINVAEKVYGYIAEKLGRTV